MTLDPILNASPAIQFHFFTVVPAVVLGAVVLWAKKGTPAHRFAGRIWMVLMVVTALSTFFIHTIRSWGLFSPIHLLSVITVIGCIRAVWAARTGRIVYHQRLVKVIYAAGLIAGVFTFLPGRIMHDVAFATSAHTVSAQTGVVQAGFVAPAFMLGVVSGTPLWVWGVLALLIWRGLKLMQDRETSMGRLLLVPAVLVLLALSHVMSGEISALALGAMLAGYGLGALVGWWSLRKVAAVLLPGNRVWVKGDGVALVVILVIFAVRFGAGTMAAVAADTAQLPVMVVLFGFLPAFGSAILAGRALSKAGINPLSSLPVERRE